MHDSIARRDFLQSAAAALAAMHVAGGAPAAAFAMTQDNPKQPPPTSQPQAKPTSPAATHPVAMRDPQSRFARLKLQCHRLPEMATFYRDTLGLPVQMHDAGSFAVSAGDTTIEYIPAATGTKPFYHFAFNIPHNKLDAAIDWMKGRAELVRRGDDPGSVIFHFPNWDAHAIYFMDPAGNIVEFIARHSLKNDAPGTFSTADILCASEIGLVAPDVPTVVDRLGKELNMPVYKSAAAEFAPVGDEHGLFIVVKTGRRWFASDLTAAVFPAGAILRAAEPGARAPSLQVADSQFAIGHQTPAR